MAVDSPAVGSSDLKKAGSLAAAGVTNAEIAAVLGRTLTAEELYAVRQARAAAKIRRAISRRDAAASINERVDAFRQRHRVVEWKTAQDPKRRARLEKKPGAWLRYYMPQTYFRPFIEPQNAIIRGAVEAQEQRKRFVVGAERGIGKTVILWGLVLMFALTGREKFPVCIMWARQATSRALRFWRMALAFNERLLADYPEYCMPYAWAKGSGFKVATSVWSHTNKPTGAMYQLNENIIVFPDNRGAIGCETINGNPRGLNHPCSDGSVLRPSLVLIDDPQSRGVAKSPVQILQTIELIDADIAGLGSAGTILPILMSGNCIAPYDVMDHYLSHPEWQGERIPRIASWPEGFEDSQSECRKRWNEWNTLRHESKKESRQAVAYYKAHKTVMVKGMVSNNPYGFERLRGHPDALYGAMVSYFTMGHNAFMAERQQQPVLVASTTYEINLQTILRRKSGYPRLCAPKGSIINMGVDINYVGFNWVVVASDPVSQTRKVVAHGKWPSGGILVHAKATDNTARFLIRRGIAQFSKEIIEPMRINCEGDQRGIHAACWDASSGKWQNAICAAIREMRSSVIQIPLKAFGSKTYRPRMTDLRQGLGWHITQWPQIGRVFVINADYWREQMQRGFVVEPTEAGALTLYDPDPSASNREIAIQICGERLSEKVVTERNEYYTWTRTPGVPNDRADALVYACALSGYEGIGEEKRVKAAPPKRKISMVSV